jgi:hypothetical protein
MPHAHVLDVDRGPLEMARHAVSAEDRGDLLGEDTTAVGLNLRGEVSGLCREPFPRVTKLLREHRHAGYLTVAGEPHDLGAEGQAERVAPLLPGCALSSAISR